MKKILKNYSSSIILILSIIIGGIIGIIFKDKTKVLIPFGELFLNLLLIVIVPLIFLTITTSIGKMKSFKRLGKILGSVIFVFIITSIVSVIIGMVSLNNIKLVDSSNSSKILEVITLDGLNTNNNEMNIIERTISTISVNDFSKLLSKDNIIALIIFSILFGLSINLAREKGRPLLNVLESANEVIQKFIKIIMYYAPIGLGCYFASLVGTFGNSLVIGYGKTFVIYLIISLIMYFVVYSIYAFIASGKLGFKKYWKNIIPPTITALATCSSAASIPVNTKAAKNIGVKDEIADTTIPLGTSFHKDGSVIGSVFKIIFLVQLFNINVSTSKIFIFALLVTLLVTAVPIGGGTISEMLIITSFGFPIGALPILTIIATIIDAPATVLNVVGDSASSMLVSRITDGKNWLKNKSS